MINKPRGTSDVYGRRMEVLDGVIGRVKTILHQANYQEIMTPIFESKELFVRGVGETSDVVSKEMYEFNDKKNRVFVLRPEGTAGVVRAVVEDKMYVLNNLPLKFFYVGSMFRYERPQAGRYRQFNQLGIETFGADNLNQDVEVISLAMEILTSLTLEQNAVIYLNYLVSGEEKKPYLAALVQYLSTFDDLCDDCQVRIQKNPMRTLDCKIDGYKFTNPPSMGDYLSVQDQMRMKELVECLTALNYQVKLDPSLVRGLDYYTGMVFEIKYAADKSQESLTLIGGGRYNNLVQQLGGPSVPAAGFGLGIERLLNLLGEEKPDLFTRRELDLYVIALEFNAQVMQLISTLRASGLVVDFSLLNNTLKTGFNQAKKLQAKEVLILGSQELTSMQAKLKNQATGKEQVIDLNQIEIIKTMIREQNND
ncbi:Histidine--tRNA ligase [Mesoplasma sp. JKS002660]|uniref:histidine--tRNA ligase n=1 Tax=Mesoplasma whartonense TaxID=2878854 RepID=UPI002022B68D|nr:histidine--tRNA ligase [Mesoplasma sp. JKS002660]MCL8213203.1 Histidine--tRNA ligase [Mesoplasma sp. JKS002660]